MVRELRRVRRIRDQEPEVRLFHEGVEEELRGALDRRVVRAQARDVAREAVVLPDHHAQPGTAGLPHPPEGAVDDRRPPPRIGVVMRDPARGAVLRLCRARAGDREVVDHLEHRLRALREVRRAGRPVVHGEVHVDRVLRVPGRVHQVVPQALEIRGLGSGPRARDQQVAAVLEQQLGELRIVGAGVLRDPDVGRQLGGRRAPDVERRPAEQPLVVLRLPRAELVVAPALGVAHVLVGDALVVTARVLEVDVARPDRDQHRDGVGARDGQRAGRCSRRSHPRRPRGPAPGTAPSPSRPPCRPRRRPA